MGKRNVVLVFLLCVTLFFTSFIYGYRMMKPKLGKEPLQISDNDLSLEILKEEMRISPNTDIERKIYYKACNHDITVLDEVDDVIINMTEKQYRDYMRDNFPSVIVVSFFPNKIMLREERDYLCPNHYIISEADGKIAIFSINEDGEKKLDRVFKDYPISLLKKVDQMILIEGIKVDSEEELSDVLENFIS